MLNLTVAMRHAVVLLLLLVVLFSLQPARAQTEVEPTRQPTDLPQVFISAPAGGEALQGLVIVQGSSNIESYQSSSVAFTYSGDLTGTWFLITESTTAVSDGALATWDTTMISDGDFDLRLLVLKSDGSQVTTFVKGLRVRNYSPIETDTPVPPTVTPTYLPPTPGETAAASVNPLSTATITSTPLRPTTTPLPTNPAEISQTTILTTLGRGGLVAVGLFVVLGLYLAGRAAIRR
jgi:hypothetical protein